MKKFNIVLLLLVGLGLHPLILHAHAETGYSLDFNPVDEIDEDEIVGNINVTDGEFDRSVKNYTDSIKSSPGRVSPYFSRGSVYLIKGKYKEAKQDLLKAREIARKRGKVKLMNEANRQLKLINSLIKGDEQ